MWATRHRNQKYSVTLRSQLSWCHSFSLVFSAVTLHGIVRGLVQRLPHWPRFISCSWLFSSKFLPCEYQTIADSCSGQSSFQIAKVKCLRPALDFSLWRHGCYMGTRVHVASIPTSEPSEPERNGSPQKLFMSPDFCQERPKGLRFLLTVPMGFLQGVIIWLAFEAPGDGV